MLTGVSLFAGVGGFDLAMQRNGVKVVATVEIDKKCNEVLAKHFPAAKQFTDVKEERISSTRGRISFSNVSKTSEYLDSRISRLLSQDLSNSESAASLLITCEVIKPALTGP